MTAEKILVVDDEPEICELISINLTNNGFIALLADNGAKALEMVKNHNPDLIILDVLLPGPNGFQICQELRKNTDIPILFLSCKDDDTDKILGLTIGGDEYISKPFSPGVLVARVKAHLRRSRMLKNTKQENTVLAFPGLLIDLTSHTVMVNDKPVFLSAKEFQLLVLLARNPNRVINIEELYQNLWSSQSFGDTRTVMVHISNLRKKIEKDPTKPGFITTIRGVGYKFNG
ncbi:phosphate regulon transcriptional regulatory protein PhoB [Desulfocucumis palustris]|uniref:Stage 0 sporulation protein A homolog n=1 Tax=Desulfocucumis palustris TaxID=1898651 RepID=A0A2L2XB16_9FIRM|nr:response regulator transcription factor [Desulfocucumis palustris]GBF33378.1 phosphate regulon transcriptional regulatory protein PhoB [Desulfocucumis palustris]